MVMHCKYACHIATTTKYYSMTIGHKKYLNTFGKPYLDSHINQIALTCVQWFEKIRKCV